MAPERTPTREHRSHAAAIIAPYIPYAEASLLRWVNGEDGPMPLLSDLQRLEDAARRICDAEARGAQGAWIPCSERMPPARETNPDEPALKRCPFCGSAAALSPDGDGSITWIWCSNCEAGGPTVRPTDGRDCVEDHEMPELARRAGEAWNKRSAPQAQRRVRPDIELEDEP